MSAIDLIRDHCDASSDVGCRAATMEDWTNLSPSSGGGLHHRLDPWTVPSLDDAHADADDAHVQIMKRNLAMITAIPVHPTPNHLQFITPHPSPFLQARTALSCSGAPMVPAPPRTMSSSPPSSLSFCRLAYPFSAAFWETRSWTNLPKLCRYLPHFMPSMPRPLRSRRLGPMAQADV